MAVYQGGKYIKQQLDSILAQTRRDWVLYIQDDGSTDKTMEIIFKYKEKEPERIQVLCETQKR